MYEKIARESFDGGASSMRCRFNGLHYHIKNCVPGFSLYLVLQSHRILNLCVRLIVVHCNKGEESLQYHEQNFSVSLLICHTKNKPVATTSRLDTKEGQLKLKKSYRKSVKTRCLAKEKSLVWIFSSDDCLCLDAVRCFDPSGK